MKVVILCGGLGTRLREETEFRPKPMVPVGGQPIIWHIMKSYACHGHREFILCLGYKGEIIKEYFRNYLWNRSDVTLRLGKTPQITFHNSHDEEDWSVTLLETGLHTQTGGRLRRAIDHVGEGNFLFTYGDGLTDADLAALVEFHRSHGAIGTLTAVRPAGRFGELGLEGTAVRTFHEKPARESGFINGGFMVLHSRVKDYLGGEDCVFEREPLERLAADGQMRAFQHEGFWQCMDTYREQQILEKMWTDGCAPWRKW
ncbi:MAG: glucose-1-phosphate cytidylyltransferase [Verrucomicrobiaceae bacterium]|nr:glucose-1-phosphate cytidylyltransferase [Verrucomicrobiaceae bacterium]